MNLQATQTNELLYVNFNQDYACFACGTDTGFRIYNCDPFKETFRRDFSSGGIGIVEMLFRCNILALVGGGRNPRYPPDKVMIWDDHQNRCIGELSFRSEVRAVKLRRDRVVVVLLNKIYVYNFADLELIDHIETVNNPLGLCAVCPSSTNTVLACPGLQKGHVRVELYDIRKTTLIPAHDGDLACLALNMSGTRLATASEKGTLIRVYDTSSGDQLQELRRGAHEAVIYCISFNAPSTLLACSSDKGTIHVFKLEGGGSEAAADGEAAGAASGAGGAGGRAASGGGSGGSAGGGAGGDAGRGGGRGGRGEGDGEEKDDTNTTSKLGFMRGFLPKYFSSEWSFAQFRVGDGTRTIVAFGAEPNTIVVVGADGSFYKASFDKAGGDMVKTSYSQFVKSDAAEK